MSSSTYRSAITCVLEAGLLLPGAALPSSKHAVVLGSGTITVCHWVRVQHGKKKISLVGETELVQNVGCAYGELLNSPRFATCFPSC